MGEHENSVFKWSENTSTALHAMSMPKMFAMNGRLAEWLNGMKETGGIR